MNAAAAGLLLVAAKVLAEELLFRGVALRNLRTLLGDNAAVALIAILFGAYHFVGTSFWAMGAVYQFLMPALGGLLFGWAAARSGGLAFPIGLHLGGNWVPAGITGFSSQSDPGAIARIEALWRIPVTAEDAQALMAPDMPVRLPYLVSLAAATGLAWVAFRRAPTAAPEHRLTGR